MCSREGWAHLHCESDRGFNSLTTLGQIAPGPLTPPSFARQGLALLFPLQGLYTVFQAEILSVVAGQSGNPGAGSDWPNATAA